MNTIEVGCIVILVWLGAELLRRESVKYERKLAERRVKRFFENHSKCTCSLRLVRKVVRMHPTHVCVGLCNLVEQGYLTARVLDSVRDASILGVEDTLTPENMSLFSYRLNK
ncbi:hypothetical protein KTR10_02500 [Candidatus Kaiserbacteria bacterium]|nr:hypothetical protein [Candidatus Kaiserbacteria bacterium]